MRKLGCGAFFHILGGALEMFGKKRMGSRFLGCCSRWPKVLALLEGFVARRSVSSELIRRDVTFAFWSLQFTFGLFVLRVRTCFRYGTETYKIIARIYLTYLHAHM